MSTITQARNFSAYLGGVDEVKAALAAFVRKTLVRRSWSVERFDRAFGTGVRISGESLPSSVLEAPNLITGRFFSRAALVLGISLSDALRDRLAGVSADDREEIIQRMRELNGGMAFSAGAPPGQPTVPLEAQADMFLQLKVMQEIDATSSNP